MPFGSRRFCAEPGRGRYFGLNSKNDGFMSCRGLHQPLGGSYYMYVLFRVLGRELYEPLLCTTTSSLSLVLCSNAQPMQRISRDRGAVWLPGLGTYEHGSLPVVPGFKFRTGCGARGRIFRRLHERSILSVTTAEDDV